MLTVSGCNFHSSHPPEAVALYNKIFHWKIITNTENHAELELIDSSNFILYFDKANSHCPTYPGTLSLKIHDWNQFLNLDSNRNLLWMKHFTLEYRDSKNRYHSWLDPWKNRIWIIEADEK
ncbi:MAG: hypothetical protein MH321_09460 [Leptospiraceae bacterium]|nr:hypothetical protein [Leptospiraceae bacterium]